MTEYIFISETEKIAWVEFDSSSEDVFDVDYIFNNHTDFLHALEVHCMAECCGLDAFSFYAEDIVKAVKKIDVELLRTDLIKLKKDVIDSEKQIICSSDLNNLMDKTVFIKLLEHLILTI
jgi:hypothetical protein